jgi:transposase
MTNYEDISPKALDKLSGWFNAFPELYEAYMVKETFRDIYATAKNYGEALNKFNDWLDAIPPMERFRAMKDTFIKRKQHILNYWSYRWTNAYTESVNNAIKKIEKAGRGYKFDVLRDRCILSINNPAPDKFDYKKAVYVSKSKRENLYGIATKLIAKDVKTPDTILEVPVSDWAKNRMLRFIQRMGRVGCASKDSP